MAEVAEWRALDSKELNEPSLEDIAGIQVRSYASPYDVPEAMRVYTYPDGCYLLVEFKYMGGEEAVRPEIEDEYFKLWLGRDSHRLCRVELDLTQHGPDVVYRTIDELSSKPQSPPRQGNYQIAKKALLSYFDSFDPSPCRNRVKPAE